MKLPSRYTLNLIFFAIGMAALVFLIKSVTFDKLFSQLASFGTAFFLTFAIDFSSIVCSTRGWHLVFLPQFRISHPRLILTSIASNSLGESFSVGQGSELVKANLMRGLTPASEIASTLLLYNYLHVFVTSSEVFISALVALCAAPFDFTVRLVVFLLAATVWSAVFLLSFFLRQGACQRILLWLRRIPLRFLHAGPGLLESARIVDERLGGFVHDSPKDFLAALFWLLLGRLFNMLEIFVILYVLGADSSLAVVAAVFATTAMANYLLMILPAREGFLEGTSYVIFGLLGLSKANGLSFEIIRRIRKMGFQIIGLVLIVFLSKTPAAPSDAAKG